MVPILEILIAYSLLIVIFVQTRVQVKALKRKNRFDEYNTVIEYIDILSEIHSKHIELLVKSVKRDKRICESEENTVARTTNHLKYLALEKFAFKIKYLNMDMKVIKNTVGDEIKNLVIDCTSKKDRVFEDYTKNPEFKYAICLIKKLGMYSFK